MSGLKDDFSISMTTPEIIAEIETSGVELAPEPYFVEPEPDDEPEAELEPEPEPEPAPAPASKVPLSKKSRRDVEVLVEEVRRRLVDGDSDLAIAEDLSLTRVEYRRIKARMYETAIDGFSAKSAEEQFVDFTIEQEKCIQELDGMIKHFSTTKQHNAMVGAIRAKSQILSDIHRTGVKMGVVKQEASFDREVAGVRISELSNDELRKTIADELRNLKGVIDRFGEKPMSKVVEPSKLSDPTIKRVKH
jgi:hypothetical protein